MPAALGQVGSATGSSSPLVVSLGSASEAGTLLIVFLIYAGTSDLAISGVTDDAGNTYAQVPSAIASFVQSGVTGFADIWYAVNNVGGAVNVNIAVSGTAIVTMFGGVAEVSGIVGSSPLDGSGHTVSNGTGSGTSYAGPSFSTTVTDFLFSFGDAATSFTAVSSPWTFDNFAYVENASSGSYQPVFTASGSNGSYLLTAAAFKVSSSPSAGPSLMMSGMGI